MKEDWDDYTDPDITDILHSLDAIAWISCTGNLTVAALLRHGKGVIEYRHGYRHGLRQFFHHPDSQWIYLATQEPGWHPDATRDDFIGKRTVTARNDEE